MVVVVGVSGQAALEWSAHGLNTGSSGSDQRWETPLGRLHLRTAYAAYIEKSRRSLTPLTSRLSRLYAKSRSTTAADSVSNQPTGCPNELLRVRRHRIWRSAPVRVDQFPPPERLAVSSLSLVVHSGSTAQLLTCSGQNDATESVA
jgi:hypothetical protein